MSPENIFTTKELAEYLKLNEKTIIKMAQQKDIPGVKVGNQWRFHRAAIDAYLQQGNTAFSDQQMSQGINRSEVNVFISRLINMQSIDIKAEVSNKEHALSRLVEIAARAQITSTPDKLLEELKKREEMLSTAVGNCIALPHPRHPGKELFLKEAIVVMRANRDLEFDAPDQKPVRLFIMICALNESRHLKILATVAKFLRHEKFAEMLMSVDKAEDIMRFLLAFDRNNNFRIEM